MEMASQHHQTSCDLGYLLAETGRQNGQAFTALYQQTSSKLFAVLIRILRDRDEAADVLQEVYIAIWRRAAQFDPAKGLTWMAIVTRNAGIDALRRRRPNHVSDDSCKELVFEGPCAFEAMKGGDARKIILQKLNSLSPNMREAVRLYYLEEHALTEVAEAMQSPLNTTKSWIRRGLQNLRSEMSDQYLNNLI